MYRDHILVNAPALFLKKFLSDPFVIAGISGHILLEPEGRAVFVLQGTYRGEVGIDEIKYFGESEKLSLEIKIILKSVEEKTRVYFEVSIEQDDSLFGKILKRERGTSRST